MKIIYLISFCRWHNARDYDYNGITCNIISEITSILEENTNNIATYATTKNHDQYSMYEFEVLLS